jgi:hypothetical protein
VAGNLLRRYVNKRLGVSVDLVLVNGKPGPVATHTPEVCYGASGFEVGQRKEVRLDTGERPAHFWTADAVKARVSKEMKLRLFWAWNGGEGWVASSDARNQFPRHRYPVLHKLYVIRDLSAPGSAFTSKDEPSEAFLQALLPQLDRTLFRSGS